MNDLTKAIDALQNRLREHTSVLGENETRTRMALIDPLLQALAWDTSDPSQVVPEFKVGSKWVDYALLGHNGTPVAVIESKRLNESLEKHRMQMINYANMAVISYAGLTNGNQWELYDVFKKAPIEDRLILEISILDNPVHECALKLLVLWRPNLHSAKLFEAGKPIVTEQSNDDKDKKSDENGVSISDIDDPNGKAAPNRIQFEDGSEKGIQYWRNVLQETARWLASKGLLNATNVPLNASKNSHIVTFDKTHRSGKEFRSPFNIDGTPLVVECHLSATDIVKRSNKLLNICQKYPSKVRIKSANLAST